MMYVDGVELEVAVGPVISLHVVVELLVRGVCQHVALVHPAAHAPRRGCLHHSDEGPLAPCAVAVDCSGAGDGVVHAVEPVVHLAHAWCPEAELWVIGEVGGALAQSHCRAYLVELGFHPFGQATHRRSEKFPVDEVARAAAHEVSVPGVGVAEAGVGGIHVVVAVFGAHHRRVVHVGQIPLAALVPSGDIAVVVGVCGCLVCLEALFRRHHPYLLYAADVFPAEGPTRCCLVERDVRVPEYAVGAAVVHFCHKLCVSCGCRGEQYCHGKIFGSAICLHSHSFFLICLSLHKLYRGRACPQHVQAWLQPAYVDYGLVAG